MSKTQIITMDTIKTIGQGALGAMTFGAYHQFTTNKIMELNNEKMELKNQYLMDKIEMQNKYLLDKMENQHKKEMNELNEKLDKMQKKLEGKRWW
jgi:predicted RNase H-like nuclease (RuvC/YqgF family)